MVTNGKWACAGVVVDSEQGEGEGVYKSVCRRDYYFFVGRLSLIFKFLKKWLP